MGRDVSGLDESPHLRCKQSLSCLELGIEPSPSRPSGSSPTVCFLIRPVWREKTKQKPTVSLESVRLFDYLCSHRVRVRTTQVKKSDCKM